VSEEKNIITYTAADIEKYWKGTLSAAEMHAMEKAAMDDPFLADALEGYKNINLADAGLDSLKDRLDKRVGIFVPVLNLKRKRFTWVRAAAAIIIIVGIGLLVQQLVFNDRNRNSMAILDKERSESVANNNDQIKPDSTDKKNVSAKADSPTFKHKQEISINPNSNRYAIIPLDTVRKASIANAELKKPENENVPTGNVQAIASAERKEEAAKEKADLKSTFDDSTKTLNANQFNTASTVAKPKANQAYYKTSNAGAVGFELNNKYNYRVVDAQKNPVPFANVMNTRDNIGTYTDVRGNFNLVSSDSVLNVQIRSLGYNAANYKLVPSNIQPGDLVLKEDERKENLVSENRKVVSSLSRNDSAEIEEPEVGWGNYNTYVANNIQIPENVRPKNTRNDVELSFDIDKNGQPINIKITRSSQCKECDEEAKRLLKEGPKWKRKGKKSKATISIAVDQK